jgi:hypothetical protein
MPNPNSDHDQSPKQHAKLNECNVPNPAKLDGSELPPPPEGHPEKYEEWLIDQSIDESFPASDPPAAAQPSSSIAVNEEAREGREVPRADTPPKGRNAKPGGGTR